MKQFFQNIKKESEKQITQLVNKDIKILNNKEKKINTLKHNKWAFQIANFFSAITFALIFIFIGWFIDFLIERDSFSFLYQIILLGGSFLFLKISLYVFVSYSYTIGKINQLISEFKINKN